MSIPVSVDSGQCRFRSVSIPVSVGDGGCDAENARQSVVGGLFWDAADVVGSDGKRKGYASGVRVPSRPVTSPEELALGPNAWLVDEMWAQWQDNPASVTESWRAYFAAAQPDRPADGSATKSSAVALAPTVALAAPPLNAALALTVQVAPGAVVAPPAPDDPVASAPSSVTAPSPAPAPAAPAKAPAVLPPGHADAELLRGAAARIATNMEASLQVPTATSVRDVSAKLLDVNRNMVNSHLRRTKGGKTSYTHFIAFAIVRALREVPAMRSTFVSDSDGKPWISRHEHVNLGIAVDVPNADGSRSLMVPCIKKADTLTFAEFHAAYETLIRKVRDKKIGPDDMAGTTVSITNPGTIGTRHSVPRLMPGQAAIIGVGAIDFPAEFAGADPAKLADIGISKTVTLTSTYDHRIIQGAESGAFLDRVRAFLMGEDRFYEDLFDSMGVPYEPAQWHVDSNPVDSALGIAKKAAGVNEIIRAYRVRGHLIADLDPLARKASELPEELDPRTYGLSIWDLEREMYTGLIAGEEQHKVGRLLSILRDAYCRTVGVEYMHIQDMAPRRWIQEHVEGVDDSPTPDEQRHIMSVLNRAEGFEKFLHRRFTGQKRFGLEGGESAIVIVDAILNGAATNGLTEVVIGMPHRGRLNTLVNVVGKELAKLFREFEDMPTSTVQGSGDVKYHLGAQGKYVGFDGNAIVVNLAPNPSHLEAVDPVVEGMARAMLDVLDDDTKSRNNEKYPILPLLMHGDSAFSGQGVVFENLNLSQLEGYHTGGTIHLIVNNQVGFTTNPDAARSSTYCSDVARGFQAPIFHVNGDDPEACYRVGRLAFEFREAFHRDVVIDMWCYRKHGHNEGDEPRYTQPLMYDLIDNHPTVRELYLRDLVGRKDITAAEADAAVAEYDGYMQQALDDTRAEKAAHDLDELYEAHEAAIATAPHDPFAPVDTAVERALLDRVAAATHSWPADFSPHPKLARQLETRAASYANGEVDWALAEAMAYGSMLLEGRTVRVAGQDSRRGTFSHRQAVLIDVHNGSEYTPLANLMPADQQGRFYIYDSSLSEYAAMGFEFGYTVSAPEAFVAWEAQFGDFVNGAQIMIDQFLVSSETKWGQTSQLTLLLPHGYEGQGPEHSSARLERFLQQCADDNIRVCNVTTAAQIFHLLRRQVVSDVRRPLILMSPKSGLRARQTRSTVDELASGRFEFVLDDPGAATLKRDAVRRVVLCTGKVVWDAVAARDEAAAADVAVVRVEQLYPWPEAAIAEVVSRYPASAELVWLQEEAENMGANTFVAPRLAVLGSKLGRAVGQAITRPACSSPAVGGHHAHDVELHELKAAVVA